MSKGSLRDKMPVIASIVTDLRQTFGQEMIDLQMRRAMKGEPTFWAKEDGIEFGVKDEKAAVPIVDGRGIFFSVEQPKGEPIEDWLRKVNSAMERIGARMKEAANKHQGGAQASRPI